MILLTGATGASGQEIARALATAPVPIRVLARDPAKAAAIVPEHMEIFRGDLADADSLETALEGVDTVLLNSGPTPDMSALQLNLISAAQQAGVRHIVKLSAHGAEKPDLPVRFFHQHAEIERALVASGIAWTILRPTFFMQNFLGYASAIKSQGAIHMPVGDGKAPYIDIRDIADVAAMVLTHPGHDGRAYALTGPSDLSLNDCARELSAALGREVRYVPVTPEQARDALKKAGLPPWNIEGVLELYAELRAGGMAGVTGTVQELTGRPARSFAQFARDHRDAFCA